MEEGRAKSPSVRYSNSRHKMTGQHMYHSYRLALGFSICLMAACSSDSASKSDAVLSQQPSQVPTQTTSEKRPLGADNVNAYSGYKHLKARIIIYTHTVFNQSQLEAILRPIMVKESVLYLRKLATQGHVVVIKVGDAAALQQKLDQIHNLDDVKLLEQDAILSIKEK